MKICYICSRYADPDINNRRRNLAEARALARWAEAQGYAVVTWWGSIDADEPPCDSDPEFRRAVLARSGALAAMVGAAGGVCIEPEWYTETAGMRADGIAFGSDHPQRLRGMGAPFVMVSWAEVEPYYRAPVEVQS